MATSTARNLLLNALNQEDFALLEPRLTRISLPVRNIVFEAGGAIQKIYFPESGLLSVLARSGGDRIEIGHIGLEGMAGLSIVNGVSHSSSEVMVQIACEAHSVSAADLRELLEESASARSVFLRYREAFSTQVEQTALAHGRFKLEQRLARWLLMCRDRLSSDEIPVTHDILSTMLGVRRAGVTTALHILEGEHLISSTRGLVLIRNRSGLEQVAGGSYGVAEETYDRLLSGAEADGRSGELRS